MTTIVSAAFALLAALLLGSASPAAAATEDIPPIRTIAGPNTGLTVGASFEDGVGGVASLPDGTLVVTDPTANSISFFAPGADGDVAPVRVIQGENTKLSGPRGVAVLADGSIAVAANTFVGYVAIFAPNASGDVAPSRLILGGNTGLLSALGIVELSDGSLAIADFSTPSVRVFAADADGDVAPARVIEGGETGLVAPFGITELADGSIAVADLYGSAVRVFAGDATGDVAPVRTVTGATTELIAPAAITSLNDGSFAVTDLGDGLPAAVSVFPLDADGDVAPQRRISGPITTLSDPMGVTQLPDGSLAATNATAGSVTVFEGPAPGRDGAAFVPVDPYRAYDSREGGGLLAGGQSRLVGTQVPAGAVAVAYNLTATGMTGSGYLAVSPGDASAGGTSTLNYTAAGQTWANAFVSGVDAEGQVKVTAGGAATQFVVDVVGYYVPLTPAAPVVAPEAVVGGWPSVAAAAGSESLFIPLVPTRAYDSRDLGVGGPLGAGAPRKVNVTAAGAVPAGATAVAYTLTQTGTTGTGFLTVGPAGQAQPDVSSINWFTANQTSANSSVVAVDEGFVDVWAGSSNGGSAQFVIDVLGYYLPVDEAPWAGAFTPIDPQRAYDSRVDQPVGPITGGQGFTTSMSVPGVMEDAVAVAYNLTATGTTGSGFLTTVPGDVLSPPVASTLNWWQSGQTLANGSVVDVPQFDRLVKAKGVQAQGTLGLPVTTFAGGGSAQYVIDVAGYYTFAPAG